MKNSPIAILAASYMSASAFAAPVNNVGNDFGASIFLSAEQTDNALKSKEDEVSELQYRVGAAVFADYENDYVELNANYSLSEMRYEKDTQEARTTTIGRTDFTLGKPHNAFDLKVSHSIQKLPKFSGALDLEENNDEKQILSIQPGFHKRITGADNFFVNANATEVDYRFEEQKNSSRVGGTIGVMHGFSAVDSLTVYVSQTEVEFEFNPEVDYSQTMAVVAFDARLRKINYRIEAGQSRTDSKQLGVSDDPYYAFQLTYGADYHQIDFSFNQQMTDSSRGFDAGTLPGDIAMGSDVTAEQVDQVLLRHLELRWTTTAFCSRCTFDVSVYRDEHEYQSLERDEERLGGALGLSYQLSRNAKIGIGASRVEQDVTRVTNNTQYTLDQVTAYYNYAFSNGLNVRVFAAEYERSTEDENGEYSELRAGITIGYRF